MFELVPYKQVHILPLLEQKMNADVKEFFTTGFGKDFEERKEFYSIIGNGVVYACGGISKIWHNRGVLWVVFNEECKRHFVPVFRLLNKYAKEAPFDRIECSIPYDFETGKRRAKMMGFRVEIEKADKYLPDGTDCTVLVLIKGSH